MSPSSRRSGPPGRRAPGGGRRIPWTPADATRLALKALARRYRHLTAELRGLDAQLARLVGEAAPALVAVKGVGPDTAAALLVAAGDNPERLKSVAPFAHLCGVAPIPASSGKSVSHRLDRLREPVADGRRPPPVGPYRPARRVAPGLARSPGLPVARSESAPTTQMMAIPAASEPGPSATLIRCLTVEKVNSMGSDLP